VRARLNNMAAGENFCFLCIEKMAEKMDRIITLSGGEIFNRDIRSYGVVICVRKMERKTNLPVNIILTPVIIFTGSSYPGFQAKLFLSS
jgi:hypothetical protein